MAEKIEEQKPIEYVGDISIHAWSRYPLDGINFLILGTNLSNQKRVAAKLEFYEVDPGVYDESTLTLSFRNNAHQVLIDDLWKIGLRPTDEVGSVGQLKATENHLKDIQQLVWKLLPKALRNEDG